MFSISKAQLAAMTVVANGAFVQRLKEHLTACFPLTTTFSPKDWDILIEKGMNKSKFYQLETEYSKMVYFNIMLTLGVDFDEDMRYSLLHKILKNTQESEGNRINFLINTTEEKLKETVAGETNN